MRLQPSKMKWLRLLVNILAFLGVIALSLLVAQGWEIFVEYIDPEPHQLQSWRLPRFLLIGLTAYFGTRFIDRKLKNIF